MTAPPGAVVLWWLGQQSFVVKGQERTLAFDLYLSDYPGSVSRRAYPPPARPAEMAGLDIVCCSHEHIDHLDPWTLGPVAVASPEAVFVMPESCVSLVRDLLPAGRVIGSRADQPLTVKGVQIIPIPAAHDTLDAAGVHRCQGYIVRVGGVTICHTGDTVMYDGLVERIRDNQVDMLLAPINGRDYFRTRRDIIGNLSVREAADLAAAAGVRLLVPTHWDLFSGNAENPGHLFEYLARFHPEQPCHYMARGERFIYFPCR